MDNTPIKLNETEVALLRIATQDAIEAERRAQDAIVLVVRSRGLLKGTYRLSADCTELTLDTTQPVNL